MNNWGPVPLKAMAEVPPNTAPKAHKDVRTRLDSDHTFRLINNRNPQKIKPIFNRWRISVIVLFMDYICGRRRRSNNKKKNNKSRPIEQWLRFDSHVQNTRLSGPFMPWYILFKKHCFPLLLFKLIQFVLLLLKAFVGLEKLFGSNADKSCLRPKAECISRSLRKQE